MRAAMVGAAAVMLAGCAHLPGHKAVPRGGETITYATSGCMGGCRPFMVRLAPDGKGAFMEGLRDSQFRATPAQLRAFKNALAPYRPKGERQIVGGQPGCQHWMTDQQNIQVIWASTERMSRLVYDYGCKDEEGEAMRSALKNAPILLHIPELLSPH